MIKAILLLDRKPLGFGLKKQNPRQNPGIFSRLWCAGEDLNLHAFRHMALNCTQKMNRISRMVWGRNKPCNDQTFQTRTYPCHPTMSWLANDLFAFAYF